MHNKDLRAQNRPEALDCNDIPLLGWRSRHTDLSVRDDLGDQHSGLVGVFCRHNSPNDVNFDVDHWQSRDGPRCPAQYMVCTEP